MFSSLAISTYEVEAISTEVDQKGKVQFEASLIPPGIVDPEIPGNIVDPGPGPSTDGFLRIDFVSAIDFGKNKISSEDAIYDANAQLFKDETNARGNYIQVTDSRSTGAGWSIQVRQETELTSVENPNDVLKGAYMSFGSSWANSTMDQEYAPTVMKDVIKIDKVGTTYEVARAEKDHGYGTWTIEFGASAENDRGLANTLSPALDPAGEALLDPNFNNKQVYKNKAVNLFVPGTIEKKAVKYQTVLTWSLSELP